jgi:hypothetical protein
MCYVFQCHYLNSCYAPEGDTKTLKYKLESQQVWDFNYGLSQMFML